MKNNILSIILFSLLLGSCKEDESDHVTGPYKMYGREVTPLLQNAVQGKWFNCDADVEKYKRISDTITITKNTFTWHKPSAKGTSQEKLVFAKYSISLIGAINYFMLDSCISDTSFKEFNKAAFEITSDGTFKVEMNKYCR